MTPEEKKFEETYGDVIFFPEFKVGALWRFIESTWVDSASERFDKLGYDSYIVKKDDIILIVSRPPGVFHFTALHGENLIMINSARFQQLAIEVLVEPATKELIYE